MALTQTDRLMSITTPLPPNPFGEDALILNGFSGQEGISQLFHFDLDLLGEGPVITHEAIVGQRVTVQLVLSGEHIRVFNGYISRFVQTGSESGVHHYRAEMVPWLWFLTRTTDCRIFPVPNKDLGRQITIPDILEEIFHDLHFTDYRFHEDVKPSFEPLEFCVQYRETDFNFVSRLMEQYGIFYYFEHAAGTHTLVMGNSTAVHQSVPTQTTVNFAPDSRALDDDAILELEFDKEIRAGRYAHRDFNFSMGVAGRLLQHQEPSIIELGGNANYELFDYPAEAPNRDQIQRLGGIRIQTEEAQHYLIRGRSSCRAFVSGYKFRLAENRSQSDFLPGVFNVDYLLTNVYHMASMGRTYSPGAGDGGQEESYSNSFSCIPFTIPFRPVQQTPKPIVQGPQTALVVGKEDEEIWCDEYGRIKVQFHWDRQGQKNEFSCCWVRVSQSWAGKGWGAQFIPRVGQEVIVEFLEGDPDKPLATGCVYNAENNPPYALPTNQTVSTIKTMSSKDGGGFNELRFEDKKGKEQVMIHSQRRMDVRVRASLYETVGGNREERVGSEDKGDHNTHICGDINHVLKGGEFSTVEKKRNETVKEEVIEEYQKDLMTVVDQRATLNAKEIVIEAEETLSLKSDKIIAQGASSLNLKAGTVKIEGTQAIFLKCGSSFVTLTPSGVMIKGDSVLVNSGGSTQPADAPLEAEDPTIEDPFEAAGATTALPGQGRGGGGGAPRQRTSRSIPLRRAPEPPPPPPEGPTVVPGIGREFLTIEWVEAETWCSEPATLRGTTSGYTDGEVEPAEIRNVMDGSVQDGVNLTIRSNAYSQAVDVKEWLPRQAGPDYESERDLDAFAGGQQTNPAIKLRFIPNLTNTAYSSGSARFNLKSENYELTIGGAISYVKGWIQFIIQLGSTVPAGTGGSAGVNFGASTPGAFSGTDWRFAKSSTSSPTGMVYWDGSAWQNVPATWSDPSSTLLYPIGIWREGSTNKAQFGSNWPETVPAWGAAQNSTRSSVLPTWTSTINSVWTNKFDIKRKECGSTDPQCCRYKTQTIVSFSEVATKSGRDIVLAANNARSNAGAWSLGESRANMPAHEFGHHLGNPDEYAGGVGVDASLNTDGATAGIDANSMMGQNMTIVKKRHYRTISQHLASMVNTQFGRSYTYEAVTVV